MGEWSAAAEVLEEADRLMAEVGPDPVVRLGLDWIRGERLVGVGSIPEALVTLSRATDEADALEDLQATTRAHLGLARARLAAGDPTGAAEAINPAIARWENAAGRPLPAPPTLLLTALEIAAVGNDAAEAARHGSQIVARLSGPRALYAAGLARGGRRPPLARGVARSRRRPRPTRPAGGGRRHAWAWSRRRCWCVQGAGATRRGGSRPVRSNGCARSARRRGALRAEGLASRLGSGTAGAPAGAPDALTVREGEVLALLADGLSNRGDRRRARHQRGDRCAPRGQHLRQARRPFARPGDARCVRAGARRGDAAT